MIEIYSSRPAVMEEIGYNYAVYQIIDLIAKGRRASICTS